VIGTILGALFFGLVLGPLARLLLPGRQEISIAATIAAGAGAALVGGLLADAFGLVDRRHQVDAGRILVQIACAIIAIALVTAAASRRRISN
jgi:uncharacterized membrane protein YeaQ/YmgE (transglycosylase-associated protein family)